MITRRSLLAALLQKPGRLIIDTHLEVWTLDERFPFHHPERPDVKASMAAPIDAVSHIGFGRPTRQGPLTR